MMDCCLVDAGFSGWPFTWKRGNFIERLDKGMVNTDWRLHFQNEIIVYLPMLKLDHIPLWLKLENAPIPNHGRRSFRFLESWITHQDFSHGREELTP